jgi:hypothetical protein
MLLNIRLTGVEQFTEFSRQFHMDGLLQCMCSISKALFGIRVKPGSIRLIQSIQEEVAVEKPSGALNIYDPGDGQQH